MVSLADLKQLALDTRRDIDADALKMLSQYPNSEVIYMLARQLRTKATDRNKSEDVLVATVEQADPDSLLVRTSTEGAVKVKEELERIQTELSHNFLNCFINVSVATKAQNQTVLRFKVEADLGNGANAPSISC